jgi:hypothetical protein
VQRVDWFTASDEVLDLLVSARLAHHVFTAILISRPAAISSFLLWGRKNYFLLWGAGGAVLAWDSYVVLIMSSRRNMIFFFFFLST